MAFIRHSVRARETGAPTWAHDSTRPDVNGTRCSGQSEKVYTSRFNPCPQCGGWGAMAAVKPGLGRSDFPQGARLMLSQMVHAATWTPGDITEEIAPEDEAPAPYPAPIIPPLETVPETVPAPVVAPVANPAAIGDVGAVITSALGIDQAISDAVSSAISASQDHNSDMIGNALEMLDSKFQATVSSLIAPTVIEVRRPGKSETVPVGTVHAAFSECLEILMAGCPLYLVGPTGCGKTELARSLAKALELDFLLTSNVDSKFDVVGYQDANGTYHAVPLYDACKNGGLWLGDEMDAWSPEAFLAANAILANGLAAFPDDTKPMRVHENFVPIVTGNTWGAGADREYTGRNEMDAASLSRFVALPIDYDKALERQIAGEHGDFLDTLWTARDKAREHKIRATFGTRELAHAVKLLNSGVPMDRTVNRVLRRNLTDTDWAKVTA